MKKKAMFLKLNVKGFHPYYINRFILVCYKKLRILDLAANLEKQVFVPRKRERFTLLRSPHVNKKARDQFERVTHKRVVLIKISLTQKTSLKLYRFIQALSVLSVGVSLEVEYTF
jgi:ribosomal protein S10